jgi:hypothetical protein
VVVCSAVANFKARAAIRETWASAPSMTNSSNSIKVAFLLGDPENSTLQVCQIVLEQVIMSISLNFVPAYFPKDILYEVRGINEFKKGYQWKKY